MVKASKIRQYYILANKTDDIKELLMIDWRLYNIYKTDDNEIITSNFERIIMRNTTVNKENIINDFNNGLTINDIKDKYNTTIKALKNIFPFLKDNKFSDVIEEQDREFIFAKVFIQLLLDNELYTTNDVCRKLKCSLDYYYKLMSVLEQRKHPLYLKYQKLKKNNEMKNQKRGLESAYNTNQRKKVERLNKINGLDDTKLREILSNYSNEDGTLYFKSIGLNPHIMVSLFRYNRGLLDEFINNKENFYLIYEYYLKLFTIVGNRFIKDVEKIKEEGYTEPLDMYEYYANNYNPLIIIEMNRLLRLNNENLARKYMCANISNYDVLSVKDLNLFKKRNTFICCKTIIKYTNKELNDAIKDLEDKGIPISKGTLFSAIKRQKKKGYQKTLSK